MDGRSDMDADYIPYKSAILNDDRATMDTFYTSTASSILSSVVSIMSTAASATVIYLVLISPKKLGTNYHRLMLGLSIFNIIASIPIVFSSLALPKDMIYTGFEGPILGNTETCNAQAAAIFFGWNGVLVYTTSLMIYYLLSIRYRMSNQNISRRIEPCMHATAIIISFIVTIVALASQSFNPSPLDTWCSKVAYPFWCADDQGHTECLRGGDVDAKAVYNGAMFFMYLAMFVLTQIILVLVVFSVYKQEKLLRQYRAGGVEANSNTPVPVSAPNVHIEAARPPPASDESAAGGGEPARGRNVDERLRDDLQITKAIMKQACAYSLAILMISVFPITNTFYPAMRESSTLYGVMHILLRTSLGVFHLAIFIFHKVYNIRRDATETPLGTAIGMVFNGRSSGPELVISTLCLVRDAQRGEIMVVDYADNSGVGDEEDWDKENKSGSEKISYYDHGMPPTGEADFALRVSEPKTDSIKGDVDSSCSSYLREVASSHLTVKHGDVASMNLSGFGDSFDDNAFSYAVSSKQESGISYGPDDGRSLGTGKT
mmetsp:Transcript_16847/g.24541  ORF Transcript_16847/g.24541 Transcript_16847/m.24541 type:complete len:546 (-) Transcript_16847:160-1797(-)